MPRTPFADSRSRFLAGRFGMWLLLASLGVLFASTLIGFLVMRLQIGATKAGWPQLPPLPRVLWASTAVILVSSVTMQWALLSIRHDAQRLLTLAILVTLVLGVAFMSLQAFAWLEWLAPALERWSASPERRFAVTCFYMLTGIHALHVVGGLIPMALIASRARRGAYTASNHLGVQLCAMYWHFLDGVWLIVFASLHAGV
jgi:cytochrome c oxidase subunit III